MGGTGLIPETRHAVKSDTSPRSIFTNQTELNKKIEKLNRERENAKLELKGLNQFQCMMISKIKFDQEMSDQDLLEKFKKQYQMAVPLTCVDMVLVSGLEVEEEKVEEKLEGEEGEEGQGTPPV